MADRTEAYESLVRGYLFLVIRLFLPESARYDMMPFKLCHFKAVKARTPPLPVFFTHRSPRRFLPGHNRRNILIADITCRTATRSSLFSAYPNLGQNRLTAMRTEPGVLDLMGHERPFQSATHTFKLNKNINRRLTHIKSSCFKG